MKRIYITLLAIIILPLFFPIFVKAYTPPSTLDDVKSWFASYGYTNIDNIVSTLYNYSTSNKVYCICRADDLQSGSQACILFCFEDKGGNLVIDPFNGNTWIYQNMNNDNVSYKASWYVISYNFNNNTYTTLSSAQSNTGLIATGISFSRDSVLNRSDVGPVVDYDNPIFSSVIPTPDMTVTYVNASPFLPTVNNGVYVDCIVPEEDAFYVQLQAKFSCADMVQVNLNNGVISYDYLNWTDGVLVDLFPLNVNQSSIHVTAEDFQSSWDSVIDTLAELSDFPTFTTSVPFWIQNPSADMYVNSKNRYRNVLMRQAPLYGSRMELFARYYAVVDTNVYVGNWIHWNSANPSNTEELGNSYQNDQPFPGYQNTSTDTNLPNENDTYTNFGENTSVDNNPYAQIIVNNNVPNYPDYPTVASYNHDNILVQFISTANQLPKFFGDFGSFLTTSFSFIPSYIWAVIGFGFMCSIVVMIIKVL